MEWVEGLDRRDGELVARIVCPSQPDRLEALSAMHLPGTTGSRAGRVSIDTDFKNWSTASACEYLAGFGIELEVAERHRVFSVPHDGVRYLIPTLVLMKAMFRPFSQLTPFLFAPSGLELMSVPDTGCPQPSVHFMPGVLDTHSRRTSSVREPLSWYWSFPTARQFWDSAYAWARKGHLALDLPSAGIGLVIKGRLKGATCCVTDCSVIQVSAKEEPHDFARNHHRRICFHDGAGLRVQRKGTKGRPAPLSDGKVLMRGSTWSLSDDEWDTVKQILASTGSSWRRKRKHAPRALLDGIIEKIGTGVPWQKMTYKAGDWRNACWEYRKLRNGGQWEQICSLLATTRTPDTCQCLSRTSSARLYRPVTVSPDRSPSAVKPGNEQLGTHVAKTGLSRMPGTKW